MSCTELSSRLCTSLVVERGPTNRSAAKSTALAAAEEREVELRRAMRDGEARLRERLGQLEAENASLRRWVCPCRVIAGFNLQQAISQQRCRPQALPCPGGVVHLHPARSVRQKDRQIIHSVHAEADMASLQRWLRNKRLPDCDSFDMQCKLSCMIYGRNLQQSAHNALPALRNIHTWYTGSD